MCLLQINKKNCLHCGKGNGEYCEECYQELIAKNMDLQLHKNGYKMEYERLKKSLQGIIEQKDNYIEELEHIRNCYYIEIQNRKTFRLDKPLTATPRQMMLIIKSEIEKGGF